jgi:hypothetical protein
MSGRSDPGERDESGGRRSTVRVGIVGPGRSRNGLAPFVAGFLEEAGLQVVAAVGRSAERTRAACADLSERLGHEVAVARDLDALRDQHGIELLSVHSPAEAHLTALRWAAARGDVDVFCDKPFVVAEQTGAGLAALEELRAAGRVVVELSQWPESIGCFDELWPGARASGVHRFELGMSPSRPGPSMVVESLSHLLTLAQVLGGDPEPELVAAEVPRLDAGSEAALLRLDLRACGRPLEANLRLQVKTGQPRPAWLVVDGRRMDRDVDTSGGGYGIGFVREGGMRVAAGDPLRSLVYRAALLIKERPVDGTRLEAQRIRGRARLFAAVSRQLD